MVPYMVHALRSNWLAAPVCLHMCAVQAGSCKATPAATASYCIQSGDTYWALEQRHGWPSGTLTRLNPGLNPRTLQVGTPLCVPCA